MAEQHSSHHFIVTKLLPIACGLLIFACGDDSSGDQARDGGKQDAGGGKDAGPRAGASGGGAGSSGRGGAGAVNECLKASSNDCDEHATCTDTATSYRCECEAPAWKGDGKSCACADGYTEVDGECVADNGSGCSDDDACGSGHCVSGVCCASACDAPEACQVADGATCEDGETCEYTQADDGASCDDGNACTVDETCSDGECGSGEARDCDDGSICTEDSCDPDVDDPADACVHDGTGITTSGCRDDDMCGSAYACNGNVRGDCVATVPAEPCPPATDPCEESFCDGATGCGMRAKADGEACEDDRCMTGKTCEAGACTGGSAKDCSDGNDCTTDLCAADRGCYPDFNTDSCDDNDLCTSGDVCHDGSCTGVSSVTCTAQDQCHMIGVCNPATGSCSQPAKTDGSACNDNDMCTTQDLCTAGSCVGSGNCVGECTLTPAPCDPNATCFDPSETTPNNVQCTCKAGFTGNGRTCTDINECAGNPCGAGRGTCSEPAPGTYSCDCDEQMGFKEVVTAGGRTCVCDMSGTFALKTVSTVTWDPVFLTPTIKLLEGGTGETISWGIRKQTYGADGKLNAEARACSGTAPDICDSADFGIPMSEAYQQYEPNSFYDNNNIHADEPQWDLPRPLGGSAFITPPTVFLLGIELTDHYGSWPLSRMAVGGNNATNGASWVTYAPGVRGVVTYAVPPGGVGNGPDGAPKVFGATSADCPRDHQEMPRYPYAYIPNPTFGQPAIVSVRSGSRLTSWLDGQFDANSCNRITGTVKGTDPDGFPKFEGRFDGCTTTGGPCSDGTVDSLDSEPQTQKITATTFVLERVAEGFTCQDARAHDYNP